MKYTFLILVLVASFYITEAQSSRIYFETKGHTRIALNGNYIYRYSAKDSSGTPVQYEIRNLAKWLKYDRQSNTVSGIAKKTGQYLVTIAARSMSDSNSQSFMITVYNKKTQNILCLGNSITNGVDTFNSYRRDLWQQLHAGNYNFDFVGSWNQHHMGTRVPVPDFDMDHEGHSGWTFADILHPPDWDSARGNLWQWVKEYDPSLVLIELGTNDVFHCLHANDIFKPLDTILQILRIKNKRIKIFLAQIPPLGAQWSDKKLCSTDTAYATSIINFNKAIALYAHSHVTSLSSITIVDQYTGVDPAKDMFDDIHPNTSGERKMADRWFKAIQPYLTRL